MRSSSTLPGMSRPLTSVSCLPLALLWGRSCALYIYFWISSTVGLKCFPSWTVKELCSLWEMIVGKSLVILTWCKTWETERGWRKTICRVKLKPCPTHEFLFTDSVLTMSFIHFFVHIAPLAYLYLSNYHIIIKLHVYTLSPNWVINPLNAESAICTYISCIWDNSWHISSHFIF